MTAKMGDRIGGRALLGIVASVTCLFCMQASANESSYHIGEPADWVEIATVPQEAENVNRLAKDGVYYKLLDRQINAVDPTKRSSYRAIEYKLTNKTGVTNRSTIEIDYDPIYESVVLHELGIYRNGIYIDKLDNTDIQLLRTENDLEDLFYNGTLTLTAILQDVRVDDVIRYSYTFEGENPVYDDLVEHRVSSQYYIHMAKYSFRLLVNADTPMTVRTRDLSEAPPIVETVNKGVRTYSWSKQNLTPLKWEDDEPNWTEQSPGFSISSVAGWKDIVDWSLPKYQHAEIESDELRLAAVKIKEKHDTERAQIGAALKWVQDEIRYFGVELGENSHNPSTADETLSRRYGDCKDKTVVLIALLSELGIDAQPALVNTEGELRSDDYLYRMHAFDHVIVHVSVEGESHWIDPTRQNQLGVLGEFYEPDYGKALILAQGQTGLTTMSGALSGYHFHATDRYELDSSDNDLATFSVRTIRKGLSAEWFRGSLSDKGMSAMQDGYLDHYRETFDYIDSVNDLLYDEMPRNSSETVENYVLEEFWDIDDNDIAYFRIVADDTRLFLKAPKAAKYRKRPYLIDHPNDITDVNEFVLPFDIASETGSTSITNDYFTYTAHVEQSADNNTVVVTHHYQTHARVVPVKDMLNYVKDVEAARDLSIVFLEKTGFDFGDEIEADGNPNNKIAHKSKYSNLSAMDYLKLVFLGKH